MLDSFGRQLNYLRISVTDRCNLRCHYCMPSEGVNWIPHGELLSYEEITQVAQAAVKLGFNKVRLTGGEPLVRRGCVDLVSMLAEIEGITDLAMTTNGILLDEFAVALKQAGLHRLNISLDTLDATLFHETTRGGELQRVLDGIATAQAAGFERIKLNCVVAESAAEPDARAVAGYGAAHGLDVRFIRRMDLVNGKYWVVDGGSGGDCENCNRLRLTSNGMVKPCLFSDMGFSVRQLGAAEALRQAAAFKPESGERCLSAAFSQIGG